MDGVGMRREEKKGRKRNKRTRGGEIFQLFQLATSTAGSDYHPRAPRSTRNRPAPSVSSRPSTQPTTTQTGHLLPSLPLVFYEVR